MDASKLFNVISDLNRNSPNEVSDKIQEFINAVPSGNLEQLDAIKHELAQLIKPSIVNNYSASNLKILTHIGGIDFYGNNVLHKIETILNIPYYNVNSLIAELNKFLAERNKFVSNISGASSNLYALNIDAHYFTENIYEVGILMPENVTHNKISYITKSLNRWDRIFRDFKELVGEDIEDTRIDFVSNGSLQFFIEHTPAVATCLAITIERILKLYKNILDIRIAKNQLKSLGVKTAEIINIEKSEKEQLENGLNKISNELVKNYANENIEKGRLNEIKNSLNGQIRYIAKTIDQGIIIEIIPPELEAPKADDESDDDGNTVDRKTALIEYNKSKKQVEIIQKLLDVIKEIGALSGDFQKYLSSPEEDNPNDKN